MFQKLSSDRSPVSCNWPLGWVPPRLPPMLSPRLPNSPCPSSSSAWARQSSMVSPHPPRCSPQRLQALGNVPSQKSESSHWGVCSYLDEQAGCECVFAQGGVCQGVYRTPTHQGCGEEAPSHSSLLHPGSLWRVGEWHHGLEVRDSCDWAPPVSWPQFSHL